MKVLNNLTKTGMVFLLVTLFGFILVVASTICFVLVGARIGGVLLAPGLCMAVIFGFTFLLDAGMIKQEGGKG